MTREAFLAQYRALLAKKWAWAADIAALDNAMETVRLTLAGPTAPWNQNGPSTLEAWRAIGGKGKPTLKALRALPSGVGT